MSVSKLYRDCPTQTTDGYEEATGQLYSWTHPHDIAHLGRDGPPSSHVQQKSQVYNRFPLTTTSPFSNTSITSCTLDIRIQARATTIFHFALQMAVS
ncbi:hypothetical protein RvY_01749 [Ramazzottius varieornatus]|uniref:Uncharacterized protein n=1 Tax=Ramazzottius varieornatus TaxID=947166 RepID=A0A1D1UPG8_RAMVA|nr:hypothetical protein RvY_01749 [Ramazzottius varieornatus]